MLMTIVVCGALFLLVVGTILMWAGTILMWTWLDEIGIILVGVGTSILFGWAAIGFLAQQMTLCAPVGVSP